MFKRQSHEKYPIISSKPYGDFVFALLLRFFCFLLVALTAIMIVMIIVSAMPSIKKFGFSFLINDTWDPVKEIFGAGGILLGTVITSLISIVFAVPIAFGLAFFISDIAPKQSKGFLARSIEVMAGIPSIIYGMWGIFILVPFMSQHVNPYLVTIGKNVWGLSYLLQEPAFGVSYLSAGIVLALMIIPLMASIMREVLDKIPFVLKESAYSFSATKREVLISIIVPYAKGGIFGSIILGLGRALGETMAVTFVIGNSHSKFMGLLAPGNTISSTLANEFNEAIGTIYRSSLIELGIVLFVISFIIILLSKLLVLRTSTRGGSQ